MVCLVCASKQPAVESGFLVAACGLSPQIQEAYDTLSDPAKRREYDSTDEFDDTLPLDCKPADFFKVGQVLIWRVREHTSASR